MKIARKILTDFRASVERSDSDIIGIEDLEAFRGANPYSLQPVLTCRLSTKLLAMSLEDLRAQLGDLLLADRDQSRGASDSASKEEGEQSLARIVGETAAALLENFLGRPVRGGGEKTAGTDELCWVETFGRAPGLDALGATISAVLDIIGDSSAPRLTEQRMKALKQLCNRRRLGPASQVLIQAARARDIPFLQLGQSPSNWQFGWGRRSQAFFYTASNLDGMAAYKIARSKDLAKILFSQLGVPTPPWRVLWPGEDPEGAGRAIGFPCAAKPLDQGSGLGVSANIKTMEQLTRAVALARDFSTHVLIEKHVAGLDYRLLVVDGRLVGAVRRDPPAIVGDGMRDVEALIDELNGKRQTAAERNKWLKLIKKDAQLAAHLAGEGLSMKSVLPKGRRLPLRSNANYSTGATSTDVLDQVHPQVRHQAELLAAASGVRAAGIDYITPDISRSHQEVGGGYIEINTTPDLFVHLAAGMSEEQIGSLILGEQPGRIPVQLLLVPEKAAGPAAELLRSQVASSEDMAGSAANWAQVGSVRLAARDLRPLAVAEMPLRYPIAALAILWTVEDMERLGLPLDRYDSITMLGGIADEPWTTVLHKLSDDVRVAGDLGAAVDFMFGQMAATCLPT